MDPSSHEEAPQSRAPQTEQPQAVISYRGASTATIDGEAATGRIIVVILLRLTALQQALVGVIAVVGICADVAGYGTLNDVSMYEWVRALSPIGIGLAVWFAAAPVSYMLFQGLPPRSDEVPLLSLQVGATRLLAIGISILGIYLIAMACRHLTTLAFWVAFEPSPFNTNQRSSGIRQASYDFLIEVVVGIAVFWWSRRLAAVGSWMSRRVVGRGEAPHVDVQTSV